MNKIFTIGHSVVETKIFIKKLQENKIDILVDVRTKPYSSRVTQFNRETLSTELNRHEILYLYRGKNLGGLGENTNFNETIKELIALSKKKNIALMCSEGNYQKCHRYLMLMPEFESKGITVEHISWNTRKSGFQQKLFS